MDSRENIVVQTSSNGALLAKQIFSCLLASIMISGCASNKTPFDSVGEERPNPFHIPDKEYGPPIANSVITLDTGLFSIDHTPYSRIYFVNNFVKVRQTANGKIFITDIYYHYNQGGVPVISGEHAWGRIDSLVITCNEKFSESPIAIFEVNYYSHLPTGKLLSTEKFDVVESNLERNLRRATYFEKQFVNMACPQK